MNRFLTSKENIVIELLFEWLGEQRFNRTMVEYAMIALRVPKTAAVHAYVNQRLREMRAAGLVPYQICYFKTKDRYPWYEDFPATLSMETVRCALRKFGISRIARMGRIAEGRGLATWRFGIYLIAASSL